MGAATGESLPPWEPNHTDTFCADTDVVAVARGVAVMTGAAAEHAVEAKTDDPRHHGGDEKNQCLRIRHFRNLGLWPSRPGRP
jgi:hypothetical protein